MKNQKHIRYKEGQWFAIPLRNGGYALGIIVRGSYRTKGGLGYFFGQVFHELPSDKDSLEKKPEDAVLVTKFGDLGIISGRWPIINSTRPFNKEEWPIPKFGSKISLLPGKGYIREYRQNKRGDLILLRETVVDDKDIVDLPKDVSMGGGSIEIMLTDMLKDSS